MRIWCFFTIILFFIYSAIPLHHLAPVLCTLAYFLAFNLFGLFLVSIATLSADCFTFGLSIVLMLHNASFVLLLPAVSISPLQTRFWILFGLISGLFACEALFSFHSARSNTYEGVKPPEDVDGRIVDALVVRKHLEIFKFPNVFIASLLLCVVGLPPTSAYTASSSLALPFSFLTYIQQLSISTGFHEENRLQRILALILSFVKLPMAAGMIAWYSLEISYGVISVSFGSALLILLGDAIVTTVAMNYVLVQDTLKFGSGLTRFFIEPII